MSGTAAGPPLRRVVVTGGSGFIGRRLVARLQTAGWAVTVLSRHPETAALPVGVRAVAWRSPDADDGWRRAMAEADAAVHLAGASIAAGRWTPRAKAEIMASRVAGAADLLAAAAPRLSALVAASAVGYYGPCGDEVVTEDHPPGEDFLATVCLRAEAEAERLAARGVRVVRLRTGLVLGRGGGALGRLALPFRLYVGGPLGDGRQWVPWIHLDDAVEAIVWLLDRSQAAGPFNLTAPQPVRNRDLARALGRALRRPSGLAVPAPLLRLALGEMADALLTGQRAVPARLLDLGFQFKYAEVEAALAEALAPASTDRAPTPPPPQG